MKVEGITGHAFIGNQINIDVIDAIVLAKRIAAIEEAIKAKGDNTYLRLDPKQADSLRELTMFVKKIIRNFGVNFEEAETSLFTPIEHEDVKE